MEKSLATELAPSRVESQLVLYQIEHAPLRRFQPVTQVLHLVLSLVRRRRRRRRRRKRRRRRVLPLIIFLFRRGHRLHILLPRHSQKKKLKKRKKYILITGLCWTKGFQFPEWIYLATTSCYMYM